ncbi:SIR2 family protein [Candidatus Dojkabacteria bacterium]|nr:SIR2 family protein [Candidatus Dojkabacteria bacterium]
MMKRTKSTHSITKFLAPGEKDWKPLGIQNGGSVPQDEATLKKIEKNQEKVRGILLSSLQMPNLIVLSGSGTSMGQAGGPSMGDLWEKATSKRYKNDLDENGKKKSIEIDPKDISKKVGYDFNERDIELLLTKCEAFLQVNDDMQIELFVTEAKKVILEECTQFLVDENLSGHRTFLHRLSKRRNRDPRLKIFTTNYDLCFERAAALQGLITLDGFSYTFPRRYDPNYFNLDIVRRINDRNESANFLEGVFQLFKLHGSVNWERVGNEIIEKTEPKPEYACIIYPAQGKYQQSYIQPHLELFSRYLSSLREPNTCLILTGFGFNDNHLSEPILSAIDTNPHLKVIIADYRAEELHDNEENEYWKMLSERAYTGEDIWLFNISFQNFANLIPDLKALTTAQKLEQTIKDISS